MRKNEILTSIFFWFAIENMIIIIIVDNCRYFRHGLLIFSGIDIKQQQQKVQTIQIIKC